MNDPDNFLSRWSRRKRGAGADDPSAEKTDAELHDRNASPGGEPKQVAPKGETASPPAFDVASLPPIESIGAGTDISAFMQTGVPTALRHAALRRAWSVDPAIKDYLGPTENFWDAAGPDGIPGFGDLDPGFDVKRMVSELFGETAADNPEPKQHDSAKAPARLEKDSQAHHDTGKNVDASPDESAPQQNENAATQKQAAQAPPMQQMRRRHGGAMPE